MYYTHHICTDWIKLISPWCGRYEQEAAIMNWLLTSQPSLVLFSETKRTSLVTHRFAMTSSLPRWPDSPLILSFSFTFALPNSLAGRICIKTNEETSLLQLHLKKKHAHFIIERIIHQKVSNLVHLHLDLMKTCACICPKNRCDQASFTSIMYVTCILKPSNLALRVSLLIGEETLVWSSHVC